MGLLVFINSCDTPPSSSDTVSEPLSTPHQFFSFAPDSAGPALSMAMDTLRRRNKTNPFIKKFVAHHGIPAWNAYNAFPQQGHIVILVPVVRLDTKTVTGLVDILLDQNQLVFHWIPRDSEPENAKRLDKKNLEPFMLMFEQKIFGQVQMPGTKVKVTEKTGPVAAEGKQGATDIKLQMLTPIKIKYNCGSVSADDGGNDLPTADKAAATQLKDLLAQNEFALLEDPCGEINAYEALADFTPTDPAVVGKLNDLKNFSSVIVGAFDILKIQDAVGDIVNMDEFSVQVDDLPGGMSASDFLHEIRTHINNFLDTDYGDFSPYDQFINNSSYPFNDAAKWNSHDPIGAVVYIDIPGDDGSVIVSDHTSHSWTFSTITAPFTWDHPVSGNREFGFSQNGDGSYNFYTKGVDRITDWTNETFAQELTFNGADNLWTSFQEGIVNYVNSHGGSANVNEPKTVRPDWDQLQSIFNGQASVQSLEGCN